MAEDDQTPTNESTLDNPENPKSKKKRSGKRKTSNLKSKKGDKLTTDNNDRAEPEPEPEPEEDADSSDPDHEKPKAAARKRHRSSSLSSTPKPKIREMVEEAISMTQEPNGASLQIIKKFLAENFHLDLVKKNTFIRNAIKRGVATGEFIQLKGVGVSGSFKLGQEHDPKPPKKTKRQQDSEDARKKKDAKSVSEAKRIAKKARARKVERQDAIAKSQTRRKAKPAKGSKKKKSSK